MLRKAIDAIGLSGTDTFHVVAATFAIGWGISKLQQIASDRGALVAKLDKALAYRSAMVSELDAQLEVKRGELDQLRAGHVAPASDLAPHTPQWWKDVDPGVPTNLQAPAESAPED